MQPAPGGGGERPIIEFPSVDWPTLIPQLVTYFFDAMGTWLNGALHRTLDGVWSGDHNVLAQTPLALTWSLGPVHAQIEDVQHGASAVLLFALILLGLRSILGGLVHIDLAAEFIHGVLGAVILLAAFPVVIPMLIGLVNQAAGAVAAGASLTSFVAAGGSFPDPLIGGIIFVVLAYFAVRLLIKSIWRIGFLAVLLPVGILACALYAVPHMRWMVAWWARVWGGMLLAQIPSVFALAVGLGMFAGGGGGVGSAIWSIAFLQLATDLYSIIPFNMPGSFGGSPVGAALTGVRTWAGLSGMAGAGAAVASSALPSNTRMSMLAERYGYD